MTERTLEEIAQQIEGAAYSERYLESPRPRGPASFWPEYVNEYGPEAWVDNLRSRRVLTPKEISEYDEVMDWLARLKGNTARIIWCRANRIGWRKIAFMVGLDPKTCRYYRKNGLRHIQKRVSEVNYKKCRFV